MSYKQGIARQQMSMFSLDCLITADNPVRLIDMFVEQLDLAGIGFTKTVVNKEGCPPYHAKDLLKLYYYGYLNRVRSSRKLEAECTRNIELWWLLHQLMPGYHTIADFRKDNADAFKKAFKIFVSFLKGEDMLSAEMIVIDGTKIRAQNNKKNNFNEAGLAKHAAYIENKTQEYLTLLDEYDAIEDKQAKALKKQEVVKKIAILKERKQKYEQFTEILNNSADKQISTTDPQSRSLPVKDGITNVCYNIQTVADSKHSLIVEFETINEGDQGQLSNMACKAKQVLEVEQITALADKGYHTGKQLQQCEQEHITTIVAYPDRSSRAAQIDPAYQTSEFSYDEYKDCYTCPQGATLTSNGVEYEKKHTGRTTYLVKKYSTLQCSGCPVKHLCTKVKKGGRVIERSTYQDAINANNKRVDENQAAYKMRQQIIEHPFGTIKRTWGYNYTLLKGIEKVDTEMAIIFTMYNFRRAITILGFTEMMNRLKKWKPVSILQNTGLLKAFCNQQFVKIYLVA
jgi:transposase